MPTHAEKRHLPHSSQQMFNLVSDVAKYPEFLPWCVGTRIKEEDSQHIVADMVIGYKMFREKFTSRVALSAPDRINVVYENGPFKYLNNHWIFTSEEDGSCTVDFFVDFEFHSKLLQKIIGVMFNEAVKIMVHAFEKRAAIIYK
jgi:coenzyme Q-binding protein COQ10